MAAQLSIELSNCYNFSILTIFTKYNHVYSILQLYQTKFGYFKDDSSLIRMIKLLQKYGRRPVVCSRIKRPFCFSRCFTIEQCQHIFYMYI